MNSKWLFCLFVFGLCVCACVRWCVCVCVRARVFNQAFQRKKLVITLRYVGGRASGLVNNFFCTQLLHFSRDFDQTLTEALAHIVGVLWLHNFWPNYGPLYFSSYRIYSEQFFCAQLLHFSKEFVLPSTEALSSSALAHIVGVLFCDCTVFDRIMALCFFFS
jgi:hypothetical protein